MHGSPRTHGREKGGTKALVTRGREGRAVSASFGCAAGAPASAPGPLRSRPNRGMVDSVKHDILRPVEVRPVNGRYAVPPHLRCAAHLLVPEPDGPRARFADVGGAFEVLPSEADKATALQWR